MITPQPTGQVLNLDITKYKARREAGLIAIAKVGAAYAVSVRRFNQEDGAEETPQVVGIDLSQIQKTRDDLMKQVAGLDDLIEDLQEL